MAARSQTAPSLLASVWQMASSRTSPNTTDSLPSSRGSFKWPPLSPRLSRPRGWPCGRPSRGLSSDFRAHFHLLLDSPGTIGRASLRTDTPLPDLPVLRVPISVSGAAVPPGPKSRSRLRTTLRPPHLVRWQLLLPLDVRKDPRAVLSLSTARTLVQATPGPPKAEERPPVATRLPPYAVGVVS